MLSGASMFELGDHKSTLVATTRWPRVGRSQHITGYCENPLHMNQNIERTYCNIMFSGMHGHRSLALRN